MWSVRTISLIRYHGRASARHAWLLVLLAAGRLFAAQDVAVDVCVYGATSGGVIAAVQAARLGKRVALVGEQKHVGGMTSGGLGQTDIGNYGNAYIGGLAREFYTRVGQKYGTGTKFTFEPHVAETVFNELLLEAGVTLYTNQHLTSVVMNGREILAAVMDNGNACRAKMFIDASYEGDLMAKAGVTCVVGREASNQYGESLNGVRVPNTGSHQFGALNVSPYVVTNDPASGLIPLIDSRPPGAPGTSDRLIQAYNFRLCLTTADANKLPIRAPQNYNPRQYELLGRYIQAKAAGGKSVTLGTVMNIAPMPNNKTDINNNGPVSTDFIGHSLPYVEADYAARRQIWQQHRDYLQGFLYFLAHDPSVPSNVRSSMARYGFCKDEFVGNGGWPHQLYVREARRMVSDYVMTQSNCLGAVTIADSVGLAAYAMDSHNCQRVVLNNRVQNEGDTYSFAKVPGVFRISYRSIIPKTGECGNLLVPWCLSASHIAFGSIRMEPVFMILSQSAATAACVAMDDKVLVQKVNVSKLQAQLTVDKQNLGLATPTP